MLEFYRKLRLQRRLLLIFLTFLFATTVFGGASMLVLLINALSYWIPLREEIAWHIMMVLGGVIVLALLWGGWWIFFRKKPSLCALARLVERKHPELRDSLSCAMELLEDGQATRSPIELALLRQVEQQTTDLNFRKAILPKWLHPALVLLMVFGAMLLSDYAARTELAEKARSHAMERQGLLPPGLEVRPGDAEVPRGSNVRIEAEIHRWRPDARIEMLPDGGGDGAGDDFPMFLEGPRLAEFTAYSVDRSFSYRVSTRSLRSPWYQVKVYDPPVIDKRLMHISPPAYTGEESREYSKFLDITVIEGSTITLRAEVADGILSVLRLDGRNRAFEGEISISPQRTSEYQIIIEDSDGRRSVTSPRRISVIPDEAPTVEILDPAEDIFADLDEAVPLEVYAADDFGLTRVEVHISVSGLSRHPLVLLDDKGDTATERTLFSALELSRLAVEHGDVVSYYAVAWDNREPQPQKSRSEVYFIEVGAEIPPQDSPDVDGGGEGGTEEVELRALIVELKRLIRRSHAVLPLEGENRSLALRELAAALSALGVESRRVLAQTAFVLMQVEGGEFFRMFGQAVARIAEAELLVNQNEPQEAIPLQEEALSNLIKVESYLRAAFPPESGQAGDGPPSPGQADGGDEGDGQEATDESPQLDLAEMQQMLQELNRQIDSQSAMNTRFERAGRGTATATELQELAQLQQALREETGALEQSARNLPGSLPLRAEMREAQRAMARAEGHVREGQTAQSGDHGTRARDNLMNAAALLDDAIRQAASRMIGQLGENAAGLAQAQSDAAQASRDVEAGSRDSEDMPQLREQQEGLGESYERLLREMDRTAGTLREGFPEAAAALTEVTREAAAGPTAAQMTRAANALLYERAGQAARIQDQAADGLDSLASALTGAAGTLPAMTAGELRNLAERVARERRRIGAGETAADAQPIQRLGRDLNRAGEALGDRELTELGEHLQATKGGENGDAGTTPAEASARLDQAAHILHQYLRAEWLEQRLQRQRQSGQAPEKYRRLVEEYFRALAEE